jgi:hypothetical protein
MITAMSVDPGNQEWVVALEAAPDLDVDRRLVELREEFAQTHQIPDDEIKIEVRPVWAPVEGLRFFIRLSRQAPATSRGETAP